MASESERGCASRAFEGSEQIPATLDGDVRRNDSHEYASDQHLGFRIRPLAPLRESLEPTFHVLKLLGTQGFRLFVRAGGPRTGFAFGLPGCLGTHSRNITSEPEPFPFRREFLEIRVERVSRRPGLISAQGTEQLMERRLFPQPRSRFADEGFDVPLP